MCQCVKLLIGEGSQYCHSNRTKLSNTPFLHKVLIRSFCMISGCGVVGHGQALSMAREGGGVLRGMNAQALGFCKSDEAVVVMKAASLCKKI